jgi:hypothetical protein
MTSTIQFQEPGPFGLPVAQSATATAETDTAILTFRPGPVRIAVLSNQALDLAGQIAKPLESQHP